MDFISNREPQIAEMLQALGINSIDALFVGIPRAIKRSPPTDDDGISEYEGIQLMQRLASHNRFPDMENYLGAGCYEHHVPALVGAITSKSEFLTSYTPYQAEASQGMLQLIFEYQSAICALTGMDVSNASLYDGASACAEALLMALRTKKDRNRVVVAKSVNPLYIGVIRQYLECQGVTVDIVEFDKEGTVDLAALKTALNQDSDCAALLIQNPNFFGTIESVKEAFDLARSAGALTILCGNPLSYGLYKSPKEWDADIAVGDTQPFGIPMQFGGPHVGYIACKSDLVRQMPGRIIGETSDKEGRRCFVLTLQAREQHIRREKATSNICSNQALAALASLIAMLWYGKQGIHDLALTNYQRASYLKEKLSELDGIETLNTKPIFNEFAIKFPFPVETVFKHFENHGIAPGIDLGRFFPELTGFILIAVTETKHKSQLDRYVEVAERLIESVEKTPELV
jgi:glycine dehydrogenase subunit 1